MRAARRAMYWAAPVASLLLGLLLAWLAVRGVRWEEVRAAFAQFPWWLLGIAGTLTLTSAYIRAVRWRLVWSSPGVKTHRLFLAEIAGNGLNNVSPLRFLDEPVMFAILTMRDKLRAGELLATMGITRVLDAVVTVSFMGGAAALVPAFSRFLPFVAAALALSAVGLALLFLAGYAAGRAPFLREVAIAEHFVQAIRGALRRWRRSSLALGLTAAYWLVVAINGWLIGEGLGLGLPVLVGILVVLAGIFFATSIPGLPGGFGTFEFAVVVILESWGVSRADGLTYAFLLHLALFIPPTAIAVIVLPLEGMASLGKGREVVAYWRAQVARSKEGGAPGAT